MSGIELGIAKFLFNAGVAKAAAFAVAGAAINFGTSLLFSAAAQALGRRGQSRSQQRRMMLAQETTFPVYRFVYGETRATGTPITFPVRGEYIWGVWLLNSRPSSLTEISLYLDKRAVALTGDAFDFAGAGATASAAPFLTSGGNNVNIWVGRGAQTGPPQVFLDDAPWASGEDEELWLATDRFRNCTVLFARFRNRAIPGDSERWVKAPPLVEVEGKWSLVWDPTDEDQDPDDPDTWEYSANHAMCALDALRTNPVRSYPMANLHMPSFIDGIAVCDETVTLKSGGSEPRYRAAGTMAFDGSELEQLLMPLFVSGAADPVRIGGQLGYAAGEYRAPTVTLTYLLGDGFEAPDLSPGDDVPNELRVRYPSAARGWDMAELQPWPIPGALAEDGDIRKPAEMELPFCPSATQAMRVRKISGLRMRRQERLIGGELPPEAIDLVGGATATIALPAPYDVLDGVYEVESIHPTFDAMGDTGVAMRLPSALVKHSAAPYAWVPADDEEDVVDEPYTGERDGVALPGVITAVGANTLSGGLLRPAIRFSFDPSPSAGVQGYEFEFRTDAEPWQAGGFIRRDILDGTGKVFGFVTRPKDGSSTSIRVRTLASGGRSGYRMIESITISPELAVSAMLARPEAVLLGYQVLDNRIDRIRIFKAAVGAAFGTATDVTGLLPLVSGAGAETFDLPVGEGDFWVVPVLDDDTELDEIGPFTLDVPLKPLALTNAVTRLGGVGLSFTTQAETQVERVQIYRSTSPTLNKATDAAGAPWVVSAGQQRNPSLGATGIVNQLVGADPEIVEADWSTTGTGWSFSDGLAVHTPGGGNSNLVQFTTLTTGEVYRLGITIQDYVAGILSPRFTGGTTVTGSNITANGLNVQSLTAVAGNTNIRFQGNNAFDAAVSSVILYQQTAECLPQGVNYIWFEPQTADGATGPLSSLTVTII